MSKLLLPPDWRMLRDDGAPVTDGTITAKLGGTSTDTPVWFDKDLTQPTSAGVALISCDIYGWLSYNNNEVAIWGADDVTYDLVAQGTGYNGSLPRTFEDVAVADSTTTDDASSELALGNGFDNGAFDAWSSGSSFSNISGDGDGDETADGWFFTQPNAASNAISRQDGFAIGADAVEQRYSYRFGRPVASNSTNELRLWRLIRPEIAFRFRNKEVTLRFSVKAGANYSGAGGSLGVRLATGTAENEDGDLIDSGGFAGQQNPIDQSVSVSATAQRYELTVTLGATIKEIGLQFSYTGVGIAGAADYVTIQDVELKDATDSEEYASRPEALEFLLSTTLSADMRALMRTTNDAGFRTELGLGDAALATIGTSGNTVPKNNTANTFSEAQAISITSAGAALTLTSTDAGATVGPELLLDRNSASPATSDILGGLRFRGRSSTGVARDYAAAYAVVTDATNASEDAYVSMRGLVNGADTESARFGNAQILGMAGSASLPSLSFAANPNTGFYNGATNAIYVANNGSLAWTILSTGISAQAGGVVQSGLGSVGTVAFGPTADPNTGLRFGNADDLYLVTGGADRATLTTTALSMGSGIDLVLPTTAHAPTSAFSAGYRGAPVVSGNSAYAFPLAEAGHTVYHNEAGTRTYTIPANASVAHAIGTMFIIDNTGNSGAAGTITLSITTDTLRRGDGVSGTGSRSILAGQVAVIRKVAAQEWVITGGYT